MQKMASSLTSEQVCAQAHITRRQLDYWTRQKWVTSLTPKPGSGYQHAYSSDEAKRITLMGQLVEAGIHPANAHLLTLWGEKDDNGVFRAKLAGHVYVEVFP